ncbi:MAG: ExeM/NucH family extracellular endonuclease, partial [Actinobacteria bacterium]|nr:ExeM/NucH family extracellular endonuclease [Actinomycetota bacterium]
APSAAVLLDEVYGGGGNSNAVYNRDFVELYNPGETAIDLSGWAVQYASSTGSSWQVTMLSGTVPAGGSFLVGEATGSNTALTGFTPDVSGSIAMSGTGGKVALTSSTTALTCATGCADQTTVVDLIGWGTSASSYAGSGPAPATTNATSVSRTAHAHTADNAADFVAGTPTPTAAASTPTPTPTATETATATATPTPTATAGPTVLGISQIQGTSSTSPLVGQQVTTEGVVTATYPTGGLAGYTLQTAGTPAVADASSAVFVYSSATVAEVSVGQHVQVTGTVSEYNGLTELSVPSGGVVQLADAATVTPLATSWPTTDSAREPLESMLVTPTGDFTVTNTYSTNQYGEVGLAAGTTPLLQPTDVAAAGSTEALATAEDNAARAVVLDDGATTNFLSTANRSLSPSYVSLTNPVRVGAAVTFTSPVVVSYRNSAWKLDPTGPMTAGTASPATFEQDRTQAPAEVGGDVQIATFNVLNYFTSLGSTTSGCTAYTDRAGDGVTVKDGCLLRGAWDADDLQRQQDKIVAAIEALDADVVGLMEIENSAVVDGTPDEAVATLVAALNAKAGSTVWAFVPSSTELPATALQDSITNALIYRVEAVTPTGASRALGTQSEEGQAFANAREPIGQEFTPVAGGEPVFVAVNHLKSKGSAGPWAGDVDSGDGQGSSNESRVRQTTALRDWIADVVPEGEAVALVGDFNSYTYEDPLQVLYDAGYVDAASTLDAGDYSYSYSGLSGSLDHVLLNAAASDRATGADVWNINAEESIALEYSRYNYHGELFYAADAYRSSDHNPVLVGLSDGLVDLTLLNLNDFHGRIDANTVKVAGTIEQERAAAQDAGGQAMLLSAGDNIGASLFASASQDDQPTIDVLNALGLSASAVGNHEFDRGFADLTDRVIADGTNATFEYLGANVYAKGTQNPALPEYEILDQGGVEVAVIGVVTQETPSLVSPGGIADLDFGDPVEAVNRVAAQLTDGDESNGEADVIVAEYHDGASAGTPDGATLEEEIAAGGPFAELVTQTSAAVDVIFTGHTHKQYAWQAPVPGVEGATRPVLQTGSYGEYLGKVTLTYDPATDTVLTSTATNVKRVTTADADLVAAYPRVAEVKTIVDDALAQAAVIGGEQVGSVTADITTAFSGGTYVGGLYTGSGPAATTGRDNRSKESTLASLVADSLLDSLSAADRGGAQIGVVNPGGLRSELLYAPDGSVTYAEANSVLPFVNNLWTTTLTGAQVKTMLEQQWQTNADGTVPSRPYLQLGLSKNVTYTYDESRAAGDRITSVTINGAPLDLAASYRIGTFSFLAQGGDNFRVLASGTDTSDSGLIDRDAWVAYLQANPGLAPDFAERAVGVPELPSTVTAGSELSFPVTGLGLTSLGAPLVTSLQVAMDGTVLTEVPVTDGAAQVVVTIPASTSAGAHTLTLVASPGGTTVTLPVTVEVPVPASQTTLSASSASQRYGSSTVVLKARVSSEAPVSGTVEFVSGDTVLGSATLRGGVATFKLPSTTAVGSYQVIARYAGVDQVVLGSQSEPVTVTVRAIATTTGLVVSSSVVSQRSWLPTLLFAGTWREDGRPAAGTIQFRDGDTVVTSARLVLGVAVGVLPKNLAVGTHQLTAVYVPSDPSTIAPSTSWKVTVRVVR